jgi:phenylacetate-CoA ligase
MNRVFRLFDFSLQMQGFPMKEAKKQYAEIRNLSSEKFADYLLTQRQAIVAHHVQHNPLYQQLVSQKNSADWLSLPIMTKKHFQQPLAQRLSEGYTVKNVYVNKTSGSSGDPFIFAKDKFSHALTWANIITHLGNLALILTPPITRDFTVFPWTPWGMQKNGLRIS